MISFLFSIVQVLKLTPMGDTPLPGRGRLPSALLLRQFIPDLATAPLLSQGNRI
jgi:hypothetical protein